MLNQVIIVGRLTSNPEIIENDNGKKLCIITLAVQRQFKNEDGIYDTDFISCILWKGIATQTAEYCRKGDIVGVRGRIQSKKVDNKNELEIIADKVTFLSSKKPESGDDLSD